MRVQGEKPPGNLENTVLYCRRIAKDPMLLYTFPVQFIPKHGTILLGRSPFLGFADNFFLKKRVSDNFFIAFCYKNNFLRPF